MGAYSRSLSRWCSRTPYKRLIRSVVLLLSALIRPRSAFAMMMMMRFGAAMMAKSSFFLDVALRLDPFSCSQRLLFWQRILRRKERKMEATTVLLLGAFGSWRKATGYSKHIMISLSLSHTRSLRLFCCPRFRLLQSRV